MFSCFGRSSLPRSLHHLLLLAGVAAAPGAGALEPLDALDALDATWVQESMAEHVLSQQAWSMPAWSQAQGVELHKLMDEQIFTELSPILDTNDTIRLPADQLIAD